MSSQNPSDAVEIELKAIKAVISALGDLDDQAKYRVLKYALEHLKISIPGSHISEMGGSGPQGKPGGVAETVIQPVLSQVSTQIRDIRTLKDLKVPKSANEMSALVAYYLSEIAPEEERKKTISSADIEKYFKQAGFPSPKAPRQTLPNAAYAGYFDNVKAGQFRLNPVGFNLVAYNMPSSSSNETGSKKTKRAKKTKAKKS